MHKLDGVSIPMIVGDWRLVIAALEDKLAASLALDLGSPDEDRAAEVSEDIDRLKGLLRYLMGAFETAYEVAYIRTTPLARNDPYPGSPSEGTRDAALAKCRCQAEGVQAHLKQVPPPRHLPDREKEREPWLPSTPTSSSPA